MSPVFVRFVAVIAAILSSACAAVDDKAPVTESKPPREYRTGSNIPVKEPKATTDEEQARAAEQLRQMQQGGAAARPQ
jgi:type IV pilus biogenesis protein CpaD/CtpE